MVTRWRRIICLQRRLNKTSPSPWNKIVQRAIFRNRNTNHRVVWKMGLSGLCEDKMVASDTLGEEIADLIWAKFWRNSQTLKKIGKNLSKETGKILIMSSNSKTTSTNKTWTRGWRSLRSLTSSLIQISRMLADYRFMEEHLGQMIELMKLIVYLELHSTQTSIKIMQEIIRWKSVIERNPIGSKRSRKGRSPSFYQRVKQVSLFD